jgi:putative transposase
LVKRIQALARERAAWGYRKVHRCLRQEGWPVNHKRFYRIWHTQGLAQPKIRSRRRFMRPTQPFAPFIPTAPGQLWTIDFLADRLDSGRPFRIFNCLDVFSRRGFDPLVDFSLPGSRVVEHLEYLFRRFAPPRIIRRDGGPEFLSRTYQTMLKQWNIQDEPIPPGQPFHNGHIESYHRSMRRECLQREIFSDIVEARMVISFWVGHYNIKRPHLSKNMRTPLDIWNEHHE